MMHGCEKSDSVVAMERRAETEENAKQQSMRRAQNRESVKQAMDRVRRAARQRKKQRFTTLFHHITIDLLWLSFLALKRDAAAGVDGVTWQEYEIDLEQKLADLHARVHRGAYRAQPSRRRYIPKADGRQRPLAVAAL
jgi:RNA-directed DNA polymerase